MDLIFRTMPVSTNALYRNGYGGRYLTTRGKECKEAIAWEAREQYQGAPLEGPLSVSVDLYWPDRRKHDIDNIKALLDACTGILWEDDSQIVDLHTTKAYDKAYPRLEISISVLEES